MLLTHLTDFIFYLLNIGAAFAEYVLCASALLQQGMQLFITVLVGTLRSEVEGRKEEERGCGSSASE